MLLEDFPTRVEQRTQVEERERAVLEEAVLWFSQKAGSEACITSEVNLAWAVAHLLWTQGLLKLEPVRDDYQIGKPLPEWFE